MSERGSWFARAVLVYLVLVLVLGGSSSGGVVANFALQVLGAVLLGWRLWLAPVELSLHIRRLGWALLALGVAQFMPLPPAIWTALPGHAGVAQGFVLAGQPLPWLTLSLAPGRSLAALAALIPPLALFMAMRGNLAPSTRSVARLVVGVAVASVALGCAQWGAGVGYVYDITNFGRGPGLFANSNHQSSFLLIALALGAGWVMEARLSRWLGRGMAVWLVFGVVINLSLACIALLPIEAMALMLLWRPQWRRVPVLATMAGAGIFVLLAALFWPGANDLSAGGGLAGLSRRDFLVNGLHILRDFAPLGTGLGSFTQIYRWYENPALAGLTFVNHAHDDWLELLIEGGVLAVMPLVAFFAWLRARWLAEWRHGGAVRQVAPLCIAIEMAHSLVDYPLRTAALAGLFAVCCAMID